MSKPSLAGFVSESNENDGRQYKHPFLKGEDGKFLTVPSVTTILKLVDRSGLIDWAVGETLKWATTNWMTFASRSKEDAIRAGRYRYTDVRDERARVGSGVHETIEAEHTVSWDFPELDDEQKQIMLEWRKFNEEYIVEPLLTEFTVWSHAHQYAGTADGLWRLTSNSTGESFVTLVDIKTSKGAGHPEQRMQLSALKHADKLMVKVDKTAEKNSKGEWPEGSWAEQPMPRFDKLTLLHLRAPEYDQYDREVVPGKHDLIEVLDDDLWFEEFLGYRKVLAAQRERKLREKANVKASFGGF